MVDFSSVRYYLNRIECYNAMNYNARIDIIRKIMLGYKKAAEMFMMLFFFKCSTRIEIVGEQRNSNGMRSKILSVVYSAHEHCLKKMT